MNTTSFNVVEVLILAQMKQHTSELKMDVQLYILSVDIIFLFFCVFHTQFSLKLIASQCNMYEYS